MTMYDYDYEQCCKADVMHTHALWRRAKMLSMDNPNAYEHDRYQSIINRITAFVILLLVLGLLVEVAGTVWVILWFATAVSALIVAGYLMVITVWVLIKVSETFIDYLKGY